MTSYFDIIKLFFFLLTIFVVLFQLRIKGIVSQSIVDGVGPFILPAYFIFLWLMIWYIIWYMLAMRNEKEKQDKSYIKWFILWWIIGLILSAVYYFMIGK